MKTPWPFKVLVQTKFISFHLMAFVFFFTPFAVFSTEFIKGKCTQDYLQGCKSCDEIEKITSKNGPDDGDYYRGAQWNGLYAAYVNNCFSVAEALLKRHANPNWGGWQGSMVLSLVSKWPHDNQSINQKWARLFLQYGARATTRIPDQDHTPADLVKSGDFEPDYLELWEQFLLP